MCVLRSFSHVQLFVTLWTVCSLPGYWSELPSPPPEDLPDSGVNLASLMSPALAGGFFTTNATWEAQINYISIKKKKKDWLLQKNGCPGHPPSLHNPTAATPKIT